MYSEVTGWVLTFVYNTDFLPCNTLALLLHQRARMERLAKELKLENEELEKLKSEVNGMEHDLMQRRLRRVSCTTSIPTVSKQGFLAKNDSYSKTLVFSS